MRCEEKRYQGTSDLGLRHASPARCAIVRSPGGEVSVRFLDATLSSEGLLTVVRGLERHVRRVADFLSFDFAEVRELSGAWGLHFAILIDFARRSGLRTTVTGLQGQPAAMAWMFRHSLEVQALCLTREEDGEVMVSGMTLRSVA